jgi:hypothetical protein
MTNSTVAHQDLLVTTKGRNAIAITNLDEAVSVCANFRNTADYGFAIGANDYYGYKTGRVFNGKKQIAQIHYNGRIELL